MKHVARLISGVALAIPYLLAIIPCKAQGNAPPFPLLNLDPEKGLPAFILLPPSSKYVGRLTVTAPDGSHKCTAGFIEPNILITAAHCVQKNGTTMKYNVDLFEKEGGQNFTANNSCVFTHQKWATVTEEYLRIPYDYAFIKTTSSVTGSPKTIKKGGSYGQPVTLFGYPGGGSLDTISGVVQQDVLYPTLASQKTFKLGFAQGTSGGPWILDSSGFVVSVNSSFSAGLYNNAYMRIYGPVFDDEAIALLTAAKNC